MYCTVICTADWNFLFLLFIYLFINNILTEVPSSAKLSSAKLSSAKLVKNKKIETKVPGW